MKTGRWPQGTRAFLILSAIFLVLLPISPFQPLGWPLAALSANLASKTYDGDAVIVRVDIGRTEFGEGRESAVPRALEVVSSAKPQAILIDHLPLSALTEEGAKSLKEVIETLPDKPVFSVAVTPARNSRLRDLFSPGQDQMIYRATLPNRLLMDDIRIANNALQSNFLGAPIYIPAQKNTGSGSLFGLAQFIAQDFRAIPANTPIDQRYDVNSVPSFSLGNLIANEGSLDNLTGKTVLLAATGDPRRDTLSTARGPATSAATTLLAAQTLIDGRPTNLGAWPAYLLAVIAALAWLCLPRPQGRLVALGSLGILLALPTLMPFWDLYIDPSHGIAFLAAFALVRVAGRYRSALDEAKRAAESKSWFLAQASHDLRQPIHAIGMLSERLRQTGLDSFQQDLVRKIGRSVDMSSRMFKSLLDIAALESGSINADPRPVSVNQILAEVEETQGLAAERSGFTLRMVPSELVIMADRALTVTLLQNLVSNSIKYATGKQAVVGARRRGQSVSLCVYDQGKGIPKEDLRHVSREYFRATRPMAIEGSGLGLAIVERICSLMSLSFRLDSRPGHGTSATIEGFPLLDGEVPASRKTAEVASPLLDGLRVLIIDDDPDTLHATQMIIQQWGCYTETSPQFTDSPEFDVILSDFDLGGGKRLSDFRPAIGRLRSKGINTIVLSGHPPEFVREAMGDDAYLVLSKPLRPVELRSALLSDRLAARR